jgi:hypothetical protein
MGPDGVERYVSSTGTGPVDAVYKAIDQIMGVDVVLESYSMNSVNEGIEVSFQCYHDPTFYFSFRTIIRHCRLLSGPREYSGRHRTSNQRTQR